MNHTIPKEEFERFLPENPIILEAGAHIGRDTIKMAKRWPHSQIYAFEPVPELFEKLSENIKEYPKVKAFNLALSNKSDSCLFYKSGGRSTATGSLLAPKEYSQEHPDTTFERIEVECTTIDEWAAKQNIDHIDFMWLDMQGGELAALKGAEKILKNVKALYTEVALTERYANNPLYEEMQKWLKEKGLIVEREALGKKTWGNVLFVKK